ncbi:hypothetical protein KSC_060060 [Ktedonobacter sp. SOSP1-52]|uniref:tetratricopeptide repeat protein n=1 Tax=Ktedonobacter sp. SOSP1-52 TaxID=2778366 RepID=UPI0019165220|nr:tetratricopeptide repeat protein [Ktedonobacter sp. SOSP1-52]GHO67114.1 hypothetical protein KSC_060060 [Ktedonobacter sp. SOSP1-52]
MVRKKEPAFSLTDEEQQQQQHLLTHYHTLAESLRESTDASSIEHVLQEILQYTPELQQTIAKELSKEQHSDAADILLALHSVSPNKEVRKEARRALLRLENASIKPQWQAPQARTSVVEIKTANPPRFWRGQVSQTREQGEVLLSLYWEQGYDYTEVRSLTFVLDFWRDGVREFILETLSKRRVLESIEERQVTTSHAFVECTLAEGRRLIEEALATNTWRGNQPAAEYRHHSNTLNTLIFQAQDVERDRGLTFMYPEMDAQETAINFVGAWSIGDYGLTYDLLSRDSTLLKDITRAEWIEQHHRWSDEAHPARLMLTFVQEHEAPQSTLWLPSSATSSQAKRVEVEIGWSLELSETMLSGALAEMPLGTAINKETGRHWFWSKYTMARENNEWRVQRFHDEGARLQGLPITEIQQQITRREEEVEAKAKQPAEDMQSLLDELTRGFYQILHYYDALIALVSLDRQPCEAATGRAMALGNPERAMVYLQRLVERFPERLELNMRSLAGTYATYAFNEAAANIPGRREHFLELAEATLRDLLELHNDALNHLLLAELYSSQERNEEAEEELHQAEALNPTTDEQGSIEANLGALAMRREQMATALAHFERASKLVPNHPGIWFNLGFVHRLLGHMETAASHYKHAIELEPQDIRPYSELTAINMNQQDQQEARRVVEAGLAANPDSAHLLALHASVLHVLGEERTAQRQLEQAERLDPTLEIVQATRQQLELEKKRK